MSDLYHESLTLADHDTPSFEQVSKAFDDVAKWLHRKRSFKPEMLSEKEPLTLIKHTYNALKTPLDNLAVERDIPEELSRTLSENIFYFSGFKTYHQLQEASMLLKDEDGGFKPFDRFAQDVKPLNDRYNSNYLKAEYEFAVSSSQMAVRWKDYESDGDRYNLQYRTAADEKVRESHAALHDITLPPSDKFWDNYMPPNGWNCRCTVVQVRKGKYPESDSDMATEAGERATTHIGKDGSNKAKIFHFNPGKQQKIFPPKHPYLPKGCGDCKFKLAYNPNSEQCKACKIIGKCWEREDLLIKETVKSFANGGKIETYKIIDTTTDDYKRIVAVAVEFAKKGETVVITPKFDSPQNCPDYDTIYGSLKGTKYYGKCPDLKIGDKWYEHESFITTNSKRAFRNMCNRGLKQSDRIIIEDCGLTINYMLNSIHGQIKSGCIINEVIIHSKNGCHVLYKKPEG